MMENWQERVVFKVPSSGKEEERMVDFVNQHFIPNEPLNVAITLCEPGYRMAWFDKFVRKYISEGFSLYALDKETNEMVGAAVLTECKKSPEPSDSSGSSDGEKATREEEPRWSVMPVKFGLILELLENLATSVDLFERFGTDRYVELFILSAHSSRRYPGLGSALTSQALGRAREKGHTVCVTEATSFFSQKIFDRLGFQVLKEVKFEEYQPHGKVVFPKHGMHDSVKLMVKIL